MLITNFVCSDLHNNELKGSIPEEIKELVNLEALLLDQNQFSGRIPDALCSLNALHTLFVFFFFFFFLMQKA